MKTLLIITLTLFVSGIGYSQTVSRQILWNDSLKSVEFSDFKERLVPNFDGAAFEDQQFGYLPLYSEKFLLPYYGNANAVLSNEVYENVPDGWDIKSLLTSENKNQFELNVGIERKQAVADFVLLPFRFNKTSGRYQRLVSFDITINVEPTNLRNSSLRTYSSNSVLSIGTWYKIAVNQDGVYKLDKNFFNSIGVNIADINPHNIRIYGNGAGMLPELNSAFRYDDLQENAIEVVGESDGTF